MRRNVSFLVKFGIETVKEFSCWIVYQIYVSVRFIEAEYTIANAFAWVDNVIT
jgi:hypothetical protein